VDDTRKKPWKSILRSAVFFSILFFGSRSFGLPLRIWVMHNEPPADVQLTPAEVLEHIDKLKTEHGIILENTVQDLLLPHSQDSAVPMASYIIVKNQFLEELKEFRKSENTKEPIQIKFIRWNDAFNRFLSAKYSLPPEQMPDIIQIGSTWIASFAYEQALENLSDYINEKDFFPPSIKSARPYGMDGLYAVPWFIDVRPIYYWKDKVPQPALADMQSFKSACSQIMERNPRLKGVIGFSTSMTWNLLHNLTPWLWANGGDIIEARTLGKFPLHRVLLDDPKSLESISYLRDMSVNKCAFFDDMQVEAMESLFLKGDIASVITVPEFLRRLPAGWEEKISIAMPPKGLHGSFPFVGGSHLAVWFGAKKRSNLERAVSLISFLTTPESQRRFTAAAGFLPARREALAQRLKLPHMKVFKEALEKGRSYPAIAEWGSIVENKFVRSHFWHIWQGISQGQPMDIIEGMIRNTAHELRKRTALALWDKSRWYAISALGSIIGAGGAVLLRSRRRNRSLETQLEKTAKELLDIEGNKTALQGQILLLERREKRQSEKIRLLREKLKELGSRSQSISDELASISEKHRRVSRPLLGEIKIRWDGRMLFDGNEVEFENANQAHRLIEHLARQTAGGVSTISCLWGYPLFGWDAKKLHSLPNRLFNTAVSKINAAIAQKKRPPLLKSCGRNSWRWRCLWDTELFLKNCDITLSLKRAAEGRDALARGDTDEACRLAQEALEMDPKSLEAIQFLTTLSAKRRPDVRMLKEECEELKRGFEAINHLLESQSYPKELKELLEHEASAMRHKADHLSRCLKGMSAKVKPDQKPLHLTDILCRLSSIQTDIASLRASGIAEKGVWATVVHDDKFVGLLSIPKVQSLVNHFYNPETKMIEDPRLVQLALVLMLSQPGQLTHLEGAETDEEFFGGLEKQLKRQFRALEDHISLLPPH
jgi:multiple sugar transport system substrate-binding protein